MVEKKSEHEGQLTIPGVNDETWRPTVLGKNDPATHAPYIGVKALGDAPSSPELDLIPIGAQGVISGTRVELSCERFSTRCPVTGQPDYSSIVLTYWVRDHIVETKSFKLWLQHWYAVPVFNEALVCKLASSFWDLVNPLGLSIKGRFEARGGVSVSPSITMGKYTSDTNF